MIRDITECMPHVVQDTVCLKCLYRWIAVYPEGTLLKALQCPECHEQGYVIATGQELEVHCDT